MENQHRTPTEQRSYISGKDTGLVQLKKPIGKVTELRCCNPYIHEQLALLFGLKPVVYIDCPRHQTDDFYRFIEGFGLKYIIVKNKKSINKDNVEIFIAKTEKKLRVAESAYRAAYPGGIEWGIGLGYPKCCVEFFYKWTHGLHKIDLPIAILNNTPKGRLLPFTTNTVFNYYSRLNTEKRRADHALISKNRNTVFQTYGLTTWHSCSFTCKKTREFAKTIYEIMLEHMPDYALAQKEYMANPTLFKDTHDHIMVKADNIKFLSQGIRVQHKGIIKTPSLVPDEIISKIVLAKAITADKDGIVKTPSGLEDYKLLPFSDKL